ncbi:MAG: ribosome-associated translation inhibitor RaiA [Planctomycetes bacterium]|nr:ribosome-associated translation inhibitor RaiA [Planctomycetota bacterium]MCB9920046.1 ribosome-associated translation inhibitor RaiA [Planctomycetota bacterium]
MDIDVTTRTDGIPDVAKEYARDKFGSAARIFDRIGSVHVSLDQQKDGHHARVVAHLDSGATLVSEASSEELRHAIEQASEKFQAQVRKEKERLIDRHRRNGDGRNGDGGR